MISLYWNLLKSHQIRAHCTKICIARISKIHCGIESLFQQNPLIPEYIWNESKSAFRNFPDQLGLFLERVLPRLNKKLNVMKTVFEP